MAAEKYISFDDALAELQMATNELRSLVALGKISVEGQGLELNFRLSEVLELKKKLAEERHSTVPISHPEKAKGWSRRGGLIVWRGRAPEPGWVTLKAALQDWNHMNFRLFFDIRGTLRQVGLLVGARAFVADTHGDRAKWHSYLMEMRSGSGKAVIDDQQVFSGELKMPFLALCGGGPSELSKTGEESLVIRGLKLELLGR